ncbi:hypothetical protein H8D04_01250 [bacterium]|nr:hypothetical protein [bacterium]
MNKLLLLIFLLVGCAPVIDNLPFEWEGQQRVEIIKTTRPGILLTNEIVYWDIWVTRWTTKIQIVYEAKPAMETGIWGATNPWQSAGISKEIDMTDPSNFVWDGQYKKATAIFGPLRYPGQFKVTVRAWNNRGIWENRFKDTSTDFIIVERGLQIYK